MGQTNATAFPGAPAPQGSAGPPPPGVQDPNGAMGVMGSASGAEGAHNGAVRGQSVGPMEGMQRAEQAGNAVGGDPLAAAIGRIIAAITAKSGVPQPNPAPAPPGVGPK